MTELLIIKTANADKLKIFLAKNHIEHQIIYTESLTEKKPTKKDKLREYIEMKKVEIEFEEKEANFKTYRKVYNLRDFAVKGQVDDYPYGGGPGMLLKIEPLVRALTSIQEVHANSYLILISPQGKTFTQKDVPRLLNQAPNLVFICGHYEGFDERI
ncbi:21721_t:CDS:2 [Entrophospora sp. SA101]|nr:21721_t:CDS:2 [Entrophospora sp. SA101]